jgi:hypothetical protein
VNKIRRPAESREQDHFKGWRADTGALGFRTRGLDIKAGIAKLKADRVARLQDSSAKW